VDRGKRVWDQADALDVSASHEQAQTRNPPEVSGIANVARKQRVNRLVQMSRMRKGWLPEGCGWSAERYLLCNAPAVGSVEIIVGTAFGHFVIAENAQLAYGSERLRRWGDLPRCRPLIELAGLGEEQSSGVQNVRPLPGMDSRQTASGPLKTLLAKILCRMCNSSGWQAAFAPSTSDRRRPGSDELNSPAVRSRHSAAC
jgi:hypothetical protein